MIAAELSPYPGSRALAHFSPSTLPQWGSKWLPQVVTGREAPSGTMRSESQLLLATFPSGILPDPSSLRPIQTAARQLPGREGPCASARAHCAAAASRESRILHVPAPQSPLCAASYRTAAAPRPWGNCRGRLLGYISHRLFCKGIITRLPFSMYLRSFSILQGVLQSRFCF